MSFYENDGSWSAPGRQPSWDHQTPRTRSAAGSIVAQHSEFGAFASQFEEIERATDNLMKSGKWLPGQLQQGPAIPGPVPGRRESGPSAGRAYEFNNEPRMGGAARHHSGSDYEGGRPGSAGLQGYFAGQRFPGGRQSEAEQMLQAKRRMAAQRERELRNYHQEQQYNRTVSGVKSDRSMSPNTMSDDDRRELLARQHRALYGDNASLYSPDGSGPRPASQDARVSSGARGQSPLIFDPYSQQAQSGADSAVQMPPRDRNESTASPASNSANQQSFAHLSEAQQSSRTSNSSPGASPPLPQGQKGSSAGVAPIGTRPAQAPGSANTLNKRATTPLTPSSLSYGYTSADAQKPNSAKDERSTSAASNPPITDKGVGALGGWGSNSGVWGSGKNTLAVQPSVWG